VTLPPGQAALYPLERLLAAADEGHAGAVPQVQDDYEEALHPDSEPLAHLPSQLEHKALHSRPTFLGTKYHYFRRIIRLNSFDFWLIAVIFLGGRAKDPGSYRISLLFWGAVRGTDCGLRTRCYFSWVCCLTENAAEFVSPPGRNTGRV